MQYHNTIENAVQEHPADRQLSAGLVFCGECHDPIRRSQRVGGEFGVESGNGTMIDWSSLSTR